MWAYLSHLDCSSNDFLEFELISWLVMVIEKGLQKVVENGQKYGLNWLKIHCFA